MTHLLDTDICIALMRGRPEAPRRRFAEIGASVATSAVALFELNVGVEKSERPDFEHMRIGLLLSKLPVLPFESDDGRAAAKVLAEAGERALDRVEVSLVVKADVRGVGADRLQGNALDHKAGRRVQGSPPGQRSPELRCPAWTSTWT